MCTQAINNESRVLTFSALFASLFAIGGLVLGLIVGSVVMIFDGVYSGISLLLTLLSLLVSKYIQSPSSSQFPFGKAILEPIVIAIKASVILAVVGISLHTAVISLFNGGREVDTGIATIFGLVNVICCAYAWWYIENRRKLSSSDLIKAESMQWQMDTLLSIAITIGFVFAWLMTSTSFAKYAVYADPLMMCLISVYFIKVPYDMLKNALRELLMMPPNQEIHDHVSTGVNRANKLDKHKLKLSGLTKVGRELRVNVDINTQQHSSIEIDDIENTKKVISSQLSTLPFDIQLNVNIAR